MNSRLVVEPCWFVEEEEANSFENWQEVSRVGGDVRLRLTISERKSLQYYDSFFVDPGLSQSASLQHEFSCRRPRLAKRGWIRRFESFGYVPLTVLWLRQEF